MREIEAAITEIKRASINDGKGFNDLVPSVRRRSPHARFRKANELLGSAHNALAKAEDVRRNHGDFGIAPSGLWTRRTSLWTQLGGRTLGVGLAEKKTEKGHRPAHAIRRLSMRRVIPIFAAMATRDPETANGTGSRLSGSTRTR
jgi:hypothetical protein